VVPFKVYVCDARPVLLEGLRSILEREGEFRLAGYAEPGGAAAEEIAGLRPDLVLLDSRAGWGESQRLAGRLRALCPGCRIVVWGDELSPGDRARAHQAGVAGLYRRSLPARALLECLRAVARGGVWMEFLGEPGAEPAPPAPRLTPRETEVVRLVAEGLKNREIAARLDITAGTVKVHLMHVFEKTGLPDRHRLAGRARVLLEPAEASPMSRTRTAGGTR
jgi:DNA-binding NarL/FixJ family response regulator